MCDRIRELGDWVVAAERAGIDAIGVSDSPCLYPETYVQATIAAQASQRALIGPRVTNPVTRHPSVAASAMAALDELSDGRAIFGIGVGDSAVHGIGARKATLAELREYVGAFKDAFALGRATYRGAGFAFRSVERAVPVYLAASGPRGLELAGEIADGVIAGGGIDPELVDRAMAHLAAGAERAGRDVADVDVWWLAGASIAESDDEALAAARPFVAAIANATFGGGLDGKLVPAELVPAVQALTTSYDYSEHALPGVERGNARLLDELGLTEYLIGRFALAGSPATVVRQLERAAAAGARQIWLTMPLPDKLGFLDALGTQVIPRVRPTP